MYLKFNLSLIFLFTLAILAKDDKPKKSSKNSDDAANTDATNYAGLYQMTYYYNLDNVQSNTTQLKCDIVEGFTLQIPDSSSVEVVRDFSNVTDSKDPVYNTQQGSWIIKEVANNEGFDTIKLKVFINDMDETLVCWDIIKQDKDILINLDPKNSEQCPTRFIPTTKTCLTDHAFLFGKCISGICAGEKPKNVSGKKGKHNNQSNAALNTLSIFILLCATFYLY